MARSGTRVIAETRDDIITGAFELLGLIRDEGDIMPTSDLNRAARVLNRMIADWATEDIGIWANKDCKIYLQKDQINYELDSDGGNATLRGYETAIAAAVSSGETSITVDSIENISADDNIAVELDGGAFQWTTVSGTPTGSTVVLADALTDDVNEGAAVAVYTTKVSRILDYRSPRFKTKSGTERSLWKMSRDDYLNTPVKAQSGPPTGTYLDIQLDGPLLNVWPVPNSVGAQVMASVKIPLEYMIDATDDAPFTEEWFLTLEYCLAREYSYRLPDGAVSEKRLALILAEAEMRKKKLKTWDNEKTYFQPTPSRYGPGVSGPGMAGFDE